MGGEARLHGRVKAFRGCEREADRVIRVPLVVSQFQSDRDEVYRRVVCEGCEEKLLVANRQVMCVCVGDMQGEKCGNEW